MLKKPKFKIGRRLGAGVYDKCQTSKFSASGSNKIRQGGKRPKALSDYGLQLIEKQKVRYAYGITEKQLANYVKKAQLTKGTNTAEKFYVELESRLDNVVYRMGLAQSRRGARQMVSHGHFLVNGKKVTVPSYTVRKGDAVSVREGSKSKKIFENTENKLKDYSIPLWLNFDIKKMEGKILGLPENIDSFFDLNSVLEFYSR